MTTNSSKEKIGLYANLLHYILPYYRKTPKKLIELRETVKSYEKKKPDNVYFPPKGFKRPSLYHPLYLNEKPAEKSINYSAKDDRIKANITDVNPDHDNKVEIQKQIYDIIDAQILPVGDLCYAQNDHTYELLMHVQAGSRERFSRDQTTKGLAKANALRKAGRNNSRFKCLNDDRKDGEWTFCHLIPYGYHGSEGDERIGMRWWGRDNNTYQAEYESRMANLRQNFYWLVRIEKIETPNESGISWDYYTFDEEGNRLDAMIGQMRHVVPNNTQSVEMNVWSKEKTGENWEWSFGVDSNKDTIVTDEETEKAMNDYVWYVDKHSFESLTNKTKVSSGTDEVGELVIFDTGESEGCHLLIAGTTGSGKSVEVSWLITQLKAKATPLDVQFGGIDPNKVEFEFFKNDPYWFANPVDDVSKATYLTSFTVNTMEARLNMIQKVGVRNLNGYNQWITDNRERAIELQFGYLPHVYLVTDEFASLMLQAREANEPSLLRIAAEGRKAGIHAFLATQRPSVDVIRGTLKSNFPAKIGLRLNNSTDSSTLAEVESRGINPHQLKGRGDNILITERGRFRSQGAFVSEADLRHMQNAHKYIYFGKNPNFDPNMPEDDEMNPRYDYSKDVKVDIEGELIRSGKWTRADDGSLQMIEEGKKR